MSECKYDVLITCSGTGSRLQPLTNYLNKAMIKVGDKPAISHILESYPDNARFIITVGYLKQQVIDYLALCHPDLDVCFVEVDDYTSPSSSLLYSISCAFGVIDKPFYYHACDAILLDHLEFRQNTALVAKTNVGNQYRKFDGSSICDDPAELGELCYTGICYIHEHEAFKRTALDLLKERTHSLSDAHVIAKMSMNFVETPHWHDIGNFVALDAVKKHFESQICVLEKSDQETYLVNGSMVKFFQDQSIVDRLYQRSLELQNCVPVCTKRGNFLQYGYVEGVPLSSVLNSDLLSEFLAWCENNLWDFSGNGTTTFFTDFYVAKARQRAMTYITHNPGYAVSEINFQPVHPLWDLFELFPHDIDGKCILSRAHGDLVFENVIKTSDGFVLIDWRDGFMSHKGDVLYDVAKMKHNLLFDHELVRHGDFLVKKEGSNCLFRAPVPEKNYPLIAQLNAWCEEKGISVDALDIVVALIQLSSSGVHLGPESHLLFYMGWRGLDKILNKVSHG